MKQVESYSSKCQEEFTSKENEVIEIFIFFETESYFFKKASPLRTGVSNSNCLEDHIPRKNTPKAVV
jgi:hypothetical protein